MQRGSSAYSSLFRQWRILAIALLLVAWRDSGADLVLNEVFYDPPGADGGREYVELYNAGSQSISLDGVVLEAGNGARPEAWDEQWSAPAGWVLEPGGFLWVGGSPEGEPRQPDVEVTLHIQNGPDAVRIRRGEFILDLVGWGDLEYEEYFEGRPALDVHSGEALGRVPDGIDTANNESDFTTLPDLSPGRPNETAPTLLLEIGGAQPCVARPGEEISWSGAIRTNSQQPMTLDGWELSWRRRPLDVETSGTVTAETCQSLAWHDTAPEAPGLHRFPLTLARQAEALEVEGLLRVGTGPLVVAEVQYDPQGDEGEWVEILVRDDVGSLEGWAMEDAGGSSILITDPRPARAGERFLLAQKPDVLRGALTEAAASLLIQYSGSWPALNNGRQEEIQAADILSLFDPQGAPSDYAPYEPCPGSGEGVSLVRREPEWPPRPSREWLTSPEGSTPGRPGKLDSLAPLEGRLLIDPPLLRPGRGGSVVIPPETPGRATWDAGVFDVSGRRVRTLGLLRNLEHEPAFLWDGRDEGGRLVTAGVYLVCVRSWNEQGSSRRWAAPVAVSP